MSVGKISRGLLKTKAEIAKKLGVSRYTVREMELQGCPFPAGRSTWEWVREWMEENPHFRPGHGFLETKRGAGSGTSARLSLERP